MSILVTGGCGYIGSHTVVELITQGKDVVIVDNFSNSSPDVLDRLAQITGQRIKCYELDVADKTALTAVFEQESIEAVIHFAGYKAVGESVAYPLVYYRHNLDTTFSLLEVMAEQGCKQLIFSSSATVYGRHNSSPMIETMPTATTNPYGQTKLMLEQVLQDLALADQEWRITILRYFNPVGAHPSGLIGEKPKGTPNNLMPFLLQVATKEREFLTVFGDDYPTADGTGVRDYIHVVDLAKGHITALLHLSEQSSVSIYNLGRGQGVSVLELIETFQRVTSVEVPYKISHRRPGDVAISFANCDKAYEELGWQAEKTLEDMCKDSWKWANRS